MYFCLKFQIAFLISCIICLDHLLPISDSILVVHGAPFFPPDLHPPVLIWPALSWGPLHTCYPRPSVSCSSMLKSVVLFLRYAFVFLVYTQIISI